LVQGTINKRIGAGGKQFGIGFELRLPDAWTERFLFQGGGGMDGVVRSATGAIPISGSTAMPAGVRLPFVSALSRIWFAGRRVQF
jgi:Tannase and feruloyl esterase